jgi:sulfite exporter TauE/SafE
MNALSLTAIALTALLGSFGHCIGMCGGFVAALAAGKIGAGAAPSRQFVFQLIYHSGRITSYAGLGAICGLIGASISVSATAQGVLLFFVGLIMMAMGASLWGKFGFLNLIESSAGSRNWSKNAYSYLIKSNSISSFYLLGALNGLIPCGLVYVFLAYAASGGSAGYGALIMVIFGVCTLPALIGFGFVASLARDLMMKAAALLVAGYGVYLCWRGYALSIGA